MEPLGIVGLGKMGAGIARRLTRSGVIVHGFDPDAQARQTLPTLQIHDSLEDLVQSLPLPRVLWLMIPSFAKATEGKPSEVPVDTVLEALYDLLDEGDLVIDGGNSYFKDSLRRAKELAEKKIRFVDVGVSGGLQGEEIGYALMAGGQAHDIAQLKELFVSLAGPEAWIHAGGVGAGHFVKMVHNAIEYGMMQAIAEGFDLLKNGPYTELDMARIGQVWNHGTIIRSYLMELVAEVLKKEAGLESLEAYVEDSGEGRWSVATALEHAVPFGVNTAALYARFASRQTNSYALRLLAALRRAFGGHPVKKLPLVPLVRGK